MHDACHQDAAALAQLRDALDERRLLLLDANLALKYESRMARQQVRAFLSEKLEMASLDGVGPDTPPLFGSRYPGIQHQRDSDVLKGCIDVLFTFLRGGYDDSGFMLELRQWLEQLVWSLYRICSLDDHRYVLHHLARCRSGDGELLAKLIEVPEYAAWTDETVDHMLSSLSILVSRFPAALSYRFSGREEASGIDTGWFATDELGTTTSSQELDSVLTPEDYVSLLERYPVECLVSHVVMSSPTDGGPDRRPHPTGWRGRPQMPETTGSSDHTLDMLAFFDCMFAVLKDAAGNPSQRNHDGFQLRIAGILAQIMYALARFWARSKDPGAAHGHFGLEQAEIDGLFHRMLVWFHQMGVWKFLPQIQYTALSLPTAWRLLNSIYANGEVALDATNLRASWDVAMGEGPHRDRFADLLLGHSAQNCTHILLCLTRLALSRVAGHRPGALVEPGCHGATQFVEAVLVEIFHVTCICPQTRETILRVGRDLFATFAEEFPPSVSMLIRMVENRAAELGKVSIYLFTGMPLRDWQLSIGDVHLLRAWLLEPLDSTKHLLAERVFESVSWGRILDGRLLIASGVQHLAAMVMVAAYAKHAPKAVTNTFTSQLSSLLPPSAEQVFADWCWQLMFQLQLWEGPVMPLDQLSADLPIHHGLSQPITAYFALNCSEISRTMEVFCNRGVPLLLDMASNGYFEAVAIVLFRALPPLVAHKDFTLTTTPKFLDVIAMLINADSSVRSFAQKLSVRFLSRMHEEHLLAVVTEHTGQRGQAGLALAEFWLRCIFRIENWHVDAVCRRLVNSIIATVFRAPDGRQLAHSLLATEHRELKRVLDESFERQRQSSWVPTFMSGDKPPPPPSFADGDAGTADVLLSWVTWLRSGGASCESLPLDRVNAWLIFEALCMETALEAEVRESVGSILLTTGCDVDKAAKQVGRKPEAFVIYRWAQYCGVLHPDHPLLPLFWQAFFALFFAKRTVAGTAAVASPATRKCYGHLFLSGKSASVLSRLTLRLKLLREHHRGAVAALTVGAPEIAHHRQLVNIYGAMVRWIEEERIRDADIQSEMIPAEFEMLRLTTVLTTVPWNTSAGLHVLWVDTVPPSAFGGSAEGVGRKHWDLLETRLANATPASRPSTRTTTAEGAPSLQMLKHTADGAMCIDRQLIGAIRDTNRFLSLLSVDFDTLAEEVNLHASRSAAAALLDQDYVDDLPGLYTNEALPFSQSIACKPLFGGACTGPVTVRYEVMQQYITNSVQITLKQNREELETIIADLNISSRTFQAAFRIHFAIKELIRLGQEAQQSQADVGRGTEVHKTAARAFFFLASLLSADVCAYPITRNLLFTSTRQLGQIFIGCHQLHQQELLETLLQTVKPELFLELFDPALDPAAFVKMYSLAAQHGDPEAALTLLTKFDVTMWLGNDMIGLTSRLDLVMALVEGAALVVTDGKVRAGREQMHHRHVCNLVHVLSCRFPEHAGAVLKALLEKSVAGLVTNETWTMCLDYLSVEVDNGSFTAMQSLQTVHWVAQHFMRLRNECGVLIDPAIIYFPSILKLFETLLNPICAAKELPINDVIAPIVQLFSPFLAAITKKATLPDTNRPPSSGHVLSPTPITEAPWAELDPASTKMAQTMLAQLVGLFQRMQHPKHTVLGEALDVYIRVLYPDNPAHVLDVVHDAVIKLPWGTLALSRAAVIEMNRILARGPPSSCHIFFAGILVQNDLEAARLRQDSREDRAAFQSELFRLALNLGLERRVVEMPLFSELWPKIKRFDWDLIDADYMSFLCGWFAMRCDPTTMLVEGSTAATGMGLILTAVGLTADARTTAMADGGYEVIRRLDDGVSLAKQIGAVQTYIGMLKASKTQCTTWVAFLEVVLQRTAVIYTTSDGAAQTCTALLASLLGLLNEANEPLVLVPAITSFLDRYPAFALLLLRTTRQVADQRTIVLIAEHAVLRHFERSATPLTPENGFGWHAITQELLIPELRYTDFIAAAVDASGWFTLHAHTLQRLSRCQSLEEEQAIADSVFFWIGNSSAGEANERLLLLYGKGAQLVHNQLQAGCPRPRLANGLYIILTALTKLCEERETSGFFGAIGLGAKSKTSSRLRFVCTVLALLMCQTIADMGFAELLPTSNSKLEKQAEKLNTSLARLQRQADLAKYNLDGLLADSPARPISSVFAFNSWLSKACMVLYPDWRQLRSLSAS